VEIRGRALITKENIKATANTIQLNFIFSVLAYTKNTL
jgi:hypothetical protein